MYFLYPRNHKVSFLIIVCEALPHCISGFILERITRPLSPLHPFIACIFDVIIPYNRIRYIDNRLCAAEIIIQIKPLRTVLVSKLYYILLIASPELIYGLVGISHNTDIGIPAILFSVLFE